MYFGYAFFYFTRKSLPFVMPAMMSDLGLDESQLGLLSTIMAITYGISKFTSGMLSDRSNPRYFMSIGLVVTGLMNLCFGFSSSLFFFALFWGLNGWFQGWGWPPCARLLTHWYSQKERGTWWGGWNTSHNVGGYAIALIAAWASQHYGWRFGLYIPGVVCIAAGLFLFNRLRDTPQSLGLPPIEKWRNDWPSKKHVDEERELSIHRILVEYVLKNPYIWLLAVSYFFVYIIRMAVNDWTTLFLVKEKSYTVFSAATTTAWFEVGGALGSFAAGWSSDKICAGKRGPINLIFTCFALLFILLFVYVKGGIVMDSLLLGAIGFAIFGPQMLIGVHAAELSHKKAGATSTGFIGCFAYLGSAVAGYPLGLVIRDYGWHQYFMILIGAAVIAALFLIPLWSKKINPKLA